MADIEFQNYLRDALDRGVTDFRIRARIDAYNVIRFYIHPLGRDGATGMFQFRQDRVIKADTI